MPTEPPVPQPAGEPKNERPFTRPVAVPAAKPKPKTDPRLAALRLGGVAIDAATVIAEAQRAGLPLNIAVALLFQESGGGHNLWGHDPTIFLGGYDARHGHPYGPTVTRQSYTAYLAQRGAHGQGGMQGVGPCQLTYYSYQDEADRMGGCWQPRFNIRVGFQLLASHIRQYGLRAGVAAYNGSGPAADRYAQSLLYLAGQWAARL